MNPRIHVEQDRESTIFSHDPTKDVDHFEIALHLYLDPSPNAQYSFDISVPMTSMPITSIGELIGDQLNQLVPFWNQLDTGVRKDLKECFEVMASEVIYRMPQCCNQVHIKFNVWIQWGVQLSDDEPEVDDDEEIIEISMNEAQNNAMVRAKESAIKEALVSKMASLTKMDLCAICMEDFGEGIEVFEIPCQHFFHKECILKWLSVSHYCPCCRFELPTAE